MRCGCRSLEETEPGSSCVRWWAVEEAGRARGGKGVPIFWIRREERCFVECVVPCIMFQEEFSELLWMSWKLRIKLLFRGLSDANKSLANLKWWDKVGVDIWCFLQQALFEQDFLDSGYYQRQVNISMCLWVYFHYACEVSQSCPTLCDPMKEPTTLFHPWDFPGKSSGVGCHLLLQGIFWPRDWTRVSCTAGRCFTLWAATEACIYLFIIEQ